jgi:hypothetical protein
MTKRASIKRFSKGEERASALFWHEIEVNGGQWHEMAGGAAKCAAVSVLLATDNTAGLFFPQQAMKGNLS